MKKKKKKTFESRTRSKENTVMILVRKGSVVNYARAVQVLTQAWVTV